MDTPPTLGKYTILDILGKGGFATVYRARDTELDRDVALKVLDPLLTRDPAWVQRFRQEARAAARLNHPGIVTIHEIGQVEGSLFIAMQLIPGGTLAQRLETSGGQPWAEVVRLVGEMAAALDYAHGQRVLHRDLKPANVLLDPRSGAVLTDFGFARLLADNSLSMSLTRSGGVVGTPAYIAPEIWDGKEATTATDIYALGCITYELVMGRPLFGGTTPFQVLKAIHQGPQMPGAWPEGIPDGIGPVLAQALAADPAERYGRTGDLAAALKALSMDRLAGPYAALEAALAAGAWGEALEVAGRIRGSGPDYRDVAALEQKALAGMQNQARQEQAEVWRKEAEAALAVGDLDGARLAAQQSLQLAPGDAAELALLAQVEATNPSSVRVPQATAPSPGLDRIPDLTYAVEYSDLGMLLQSGGRHEQAIAVIGKAIDLDPQNAALYAARGISFHEAALANLAAGSYESAIADFSKAIALAPEQADYYDFRGRCLHNAADAGLAFASYAEAVADKTRAIELEPEESDYYLSRATSYLDAANVGDTAGSYTQAIADSTKAIEMQSDRADFYYLRSISYYDAAYSGDLVGSYDNAITDMSTAIELDSDRAEYYNSRGEIYNEAANAGQPIGSYEEALADYSRAIDLEPLRADFYHNRALCHLDLLNAGKEMGSYERAALDCDLAIELEPDRADFYHCRGLCFHHAAIAGQPIGSFAMAIADYGMAIAIDAQRAEFYSDRAVCYHDAAIVGNKVGSFTEAIADFGRAIELAPQVAAHFQKRGDSYQALGMQEAADADFRRARQLVNDSIARL